MVLYSQACLKESHRGHKALVSKKSSLQGDSYIIKVQPPLRISLVMNVERRLFYFRSFTASTQKKTLDRVNSSFSNH